MDHIAIHSYSLSALFGEYSTTSDSSLVSLIFLALDYDNSRAIRGRLQRTNPCTGDIQFYSQLKKVELEGQPGL